MTPKHYAQVDVFTAVPYRGNALAVVHDATGLDDEAMQRFARWTNLSETTFLLPPVDPAADYRVRIFTPGRELPFAGHPTLGSCHAWLAAGGVPKQAGEVVQQCGIGLVRVRRQGERLAFAAPPLVRSGPLEAGLLDRVVRSLRIEASQVLAHAWVDNGPGWVAVMLASADEVLAVTPDYAAMAGLEVGVVGPYPPGSECGFEVRAFVPSLGVPEDPVTGSLNAGLGQWLIASGLAPSSYVASQGTVLGRAGRVHIAQQAGDLWVGGDSVICIEGSVLL